MSRSWRTARGGSGIMPFGTFADPPPLPAAAVDLRGHRRGKAHRILHSRLLALAEVHVAIQVEQDPEVGGQRLFESLGHELAVPGGKGPVDAPEAVAGGVVANTACLRRIVGPGAKAGRVADLLGAWCEQVWDRADTWIDKDGGALRELLLPVEQAERLAHAQRGRAESHPAPPAVHAACFPPDNLAADRDHPAGLVIRNLAEVADLDPCTS